MPAAAIVQAAAGTTAVVAGISGKILRLRGFGGGIGTTGTIKFQSSGGTALTGAMAAVAGTAFCFPESAPGGDGWGDTVAGEGISIVSVTGAFNGALSYSVIG